MIDALIETWQINNRLNRLLLAAIPPEALQTKLAKGKVVAANFSHIHNVRLMWLKVSAPDLHAGQTKFEGGRAPQGGDSIDAAELDAALVSSGLAMEELLRRAGSPEGKIKGFKPHAAGFVGYLISHESFHRAMAEVALRQAGMPIDQKTEFALWEWGSH